MIELRIKEKPEDFVVKEITPFGIADEDCKLRVEEEKGKFVWFLLKKRDWPTDKAIKAIARGLHVSPKRFNWAGTKDRRSVSYQLCSAYGIEKEALLSLRIKDLSIICAFSASRKIKLGELKGNLFEIKAEEKHKSFAHLSEFPNFYGSQRFGMRGNSDAVGLALLKGEFEKAAWIFLTDAGKERNEEAKAARQRLREEQDFAKALNYFPKHLYLERVMLQHLSAHPRDFVNAFRRLPRQTLLLFVHAFQARLFNEELKIRLKEGLEREENEYYCDKDEYGFPLIEKRGNAFLVGNVVGYNSPLNKYERELLDAYGLSREHFKLKSFPELSAKGSLRVWIAPIVNNRYEEGWLEFMLPKGSYATIALATHFRVIEP